VEDFTILGTLGQKKSNHSSGPSPVRPNEFCTHPVHGAARAQAHGCQRNRCRSVQRGRRGDRCHSIASDVFKVQGEDADTLGYLRGKDVGDFDDNCFYYHTWRNNEVNAFGTLSSFLT